ncbi:MAG: conserved hypothetical protein [Methanobrevibacter sp. CfCl-M3]
MNINSKLMTKILIFKEQIKDVNDPNQIYLMKESQKKNDWWMSILITGLWQMFNGEIGRGLCLLLFGWILIFFGGWIIGIVLAYRECREYNNQLDLITYDRIKEIESSSHKTGENVKNSTINDEKDVEEICSEFKNYKEDINNLKTKYQNKEEVAKKIIKEHFPSPQLTYDRFMGEIDIWGEIFHKQAESTLNIINISPEYTPRVDEELKNRINTLKSIVEKMEELVFELTINLDNSSKKTNVGEVNELLTDMQKLIDSVKEYD